MNRIAMSPAASGLLRALIARAGVPRNRILLTEVRSTDWQSLTLLGERHQIQLRVTGTDSSDAVARLCSGLEDAEFSIPGQIVADIMAIDEPMGAGDDWTSVTIEALTVAE